MKRIALILTDHFYASGVTGTLDLLQLANGAQGANREPLFDWKIYSADGLPRTSSSVASEPVTVKRSSVSWMSSMLRGESCNVVL